MLSLPLDDQMAAAAPDVTSTSRIGIKEEGPGPGHLSFVY